MGQKHNLNRHQKIMDIQKQKKKLLKKQDRGEPLDTEIWGNCSISL